MTSRRSHVCPVRSVRDLLLPEWVNQPLRHWVCDLASEAGWRLSFIGDDAKALGTVDQTARGRTAAAVVSARGVRLGSLCCMPIDGQDLSLREGRMLTSIARSIGREYDQATAHEWLHAAGEHAVRTVINNPGQIRMVFQPMVELSTMACVGVEALARFRSHPADPRGWFAQADRVGLRVELELHTAAMAIAELQRIPTDVALSFNASADAILDARFPALVERDPHRLVVEVTEGTSIDDDGRLLAVLAELRARRVRVAIDDTGAGYAGLERLIRVNPDIVKVDKALIEGVDRDPVRSALIAGLVSYCAATETLLLAEGIETCAEFDALAELGVDLGQGYFIARPAPLATLRLQASPDRRGEAVAPVSP